MKLDRWVGLLLIVGSLDACRGSYIGAEDCNGGSVSSAAGKAGGCPACDCDECRVCDVCPVCGEAGAPAQTSSGGTAPEGGVGGQPAEGGAGGSAPGVSGSTGEAGAAGSGGGWVDPCPIVNELPTPSFYLDFSACFEQAMQVDATSGRPPGSVSGFMSGAVSCPDGLVGKSLDLAGGEVRFESVADRSFDLEQDSTIMAWIFQRTAVSELTAAFGRWFVHDQFGLTVDAGSVWRFEAVYSPDPLDPDPVNDLRYEVTTTIDVGVWTHLAVVLKRGGEMRMFENGIYVPQAEGPVMLPRTFSFQMTGRPLLLGHYHDEAWDPRFDGLIDELRLYKTALSDLEVAAVALGPLHCF